jgi:hypothetical protein
MHDTKEDRTEDDSSGMLRRVVWYKLTDISEVFTASVITAMSKPLRNVDNSQQTARRYIPEHSHSYSSP